MHEPNSFHSSEAACCGGDHRRPGAGDGRRTSPTIVVDPVEHPRLGKKDEVGLKTADPCRKWVIDSTWIKALGSSAPPC
jgi:hypothetical protein